MRATEGGRVAPRLRSSTSAIALFFAANVLFGAGLYFHAFLYNFYIEGIGHAENVMGVAAAAISAGGLLALIPAGQAIDRLGTTRAYLLAVAVASLGLATGALVRTPLAIYAAAALAGAGAGAWRVTMAPAIMRLAPVTFRSRAFSWNTALLVGSGSLWTAAAGAAATGLERWLDTDRTGGLRAALLLGALATSAAALLTLPLLRQAARTGRGTSSGGSGDAGQQHGAVGITSGDVVVATGKKEGPGPTHTAARRTALRTAYTREEGVVERTFVPRFIALLIVGTGVVWTAGALALPFYNIYFQRAHGLDIERIGVILGVGQALTAIAVFASGEGAARAGPRRMLILWMLLFPPALWGLALAGNATTAVPFYLLQAFVLPAIYPLVDQIVLEGTPEDRQGAASGWRNVATEGSGLIGATAGGYLLATGNFTALFIGAGVVALGAGLLTIGLLVRSDQRS